MADWDDDDFEAQIPNVNTDVDPVSNFDDEEDLALQEEEVVTTGPSEALLKANARKAEEEEKKLALAIEEVSLSKETAEEKKARLKSAVEDADAENTRDLFDGIGEKSNNNRQNGGGVETGLGGITVKNKQDHINFAITVASKLKKSTAFCFKAFCDELISRCGKTLDAKGIDSIIDALDRLKVEKKAIVGTKAPPAKKKETKREKYLANKKHDEMFGGGFGFEADPYDTQYGEIEEGFM